MQLHSSVKKFLDTELQPMFIGDNWVTARNGGSFEVIDPGTNTIIARVAAGEAVDVDDAVSAAERAFHRDDWPRLPGKERAALIHRLADLVDRDREILIQIESLDVGKPREQAAGFDIPNVAQTLRYYANMAVDSRWREPLPVPGFDARSIRKPYGVCAFIFPWNFPLLLLGWGISPALAAGNTVVIKPAEETPLSTLYFCRLAQEAGIPPGVINVVTGSGPSAGAALSAHPRINRMSFTGSPEVGRMIGASCGRNLVPVKLELGGKGAAVVFDDVDVQATATALAGAITLNSGQVCCTATRWFVHERIWENFIERVRAQLQQVTIGHGSEPTTTMGPVVSARQKSRILNYLERGTGEGAQFLLDGGTAEGRGHFVKPALMTGAADNICLREEIFGPVAYLLPFHDESEVVASVNASPYGLANSVWTADVSRAERVAEAMVVGNSWINAHNVFAHGIPYAGVNLSGMGGGVLGPDTFFDYLRPQSIVRPRTQGSAGD